MRKDGKEYLVRKNIVLNVHQVGFVFVVFFSCFVFGLVSRIILLLRFILDLFDVFCSYQFFSRAGLSVKLSF